MACPLFLFHKFKAAPAALPVRLDFLRSFHDGGNECRRGEDEYKAHIAAVLSGWSVQFLKADGIAEVNVGRFGDLVLVENHQIRDAQAAVFVALRRDGVEQGVDGLQRGRNASLVGDVAAPYGFVVAGMNAAVGHCPIVIHEAVVVVAL